MFSKELNVHAKTQHVEHSMVLNIREKQNLLKHSIKESKLNPINVHFVSHCQSDSEESFSFGTSRAHGALDKGSNIENFYSAKKQGECSNKQNIECSQKGTLTNIQWKNE